MKKLIAVLTLIVGFSANANLISVEVSDSAVTVGDTVQVTVTADMTEVFDSLYFELEYDSSLEFVAGSLTSDLDFTGGVWAGPEAYGLAWSFLDFSAALAGNYVLAQFDVTATESVLSAFNLVNLIAGAFNNIEGSYDELSVSADAQTASIAVAADAQTASIAVSAPATLGILSIGLICLVSLRRKA